MSEVRSSSTLPVPKPVVNTDTEEFWAGTARGQLMISRCQSCGEAIWFPRPICPFCHAPGTILEQASGRGVVYTYSVVRRASGEWGDVTPYVLAYVELEEGPRMMSNIVDCDPDSVRVGDPVEVVFFDTGDGSALPRFRPHADERA